MPGRGGRQRVTKKKSKREPPTAMDKTLLDSIYGRRRKEREILAPLIPAKLPALKRKLTARPRPAGDGDSEAPRKSSNISELLAARPPITTSGWLPARPSAAGDTHVAAPAPSAAGKASPRATTLPSPATAAPSVGNLAKKKQAAPTPGRKVVVEAKRDEDDDDFVYRGKAAAIESQEERVVDDDDDASDSGEEDREDAEAPDAVAQSTHVAELSSVQAFTEFLQGVERAGQKSAGVVAGVVVAYSTWCPKSAKIIPEFMTLVKEYGAQSATAVAASNSSKKPLLHFASIDVERIKGAADELEVDELPTIVVFRGTEEIGRLEAPKASSLKPKFLAFIDSMSKKK